MRHLIEPIPAEELKPGMYLYSGGWYLVTGPVQPHSKNQTWKQVRCLSGDAATLDIALYDGKASVAIAGHRPSTFDPATMRRKARQAELTAQSMIELAERLRQFATALKDSPPTGR